MTGRVEAGTGEARMRLLDAPSQFLFFIGKGGVGKTSLACAVALALAEGGREVLLVSTDPASNLDEMLGLELASSPRPVPGAAGLSAMNIDPEGAAEDYRARVLEQMGPAATEDERRIVREQLSGACTTEIAAFDEFAGLLADDAPGFDHVVFDTAPTGHTLRLLSLPKAWSGFLESNDDGASCLGPHSGLKMREQRFRAALAALGDPARTRIVLVARPDRTALGEAARTATELRALGLVNQHLAVNGRFRATSAADPVAAAYAAQGEAALAAMPTALARLPRDDIPLRPFDMVGIEALRALLRGRPPPRPHAATPRAVPPLPGLSALVDQLAAAGGGRRRRAGGAGARGASQHHGPRRPPLGHPGRRDRRAARRPHRPTGRDRALRRADHGRARA
jgi:arsenite-transporting ATPase